MKRLFGIIMAFALLSGCAYHSKYGKCIGIFEHEDPELEYEYSIGNAVWTVIGFEFVLPPVIWAVSCAKCPVGVSHRTPLMCEPLSEHCAFRTPHSAGL